MVGFILKVHDAAGQFVGYTCRPNPKLQSYRFITLQLHHAERVSSRDKASQRAMRFNSMNEFKGFTATVVPYKKEL